MIAQTSVDMTVFMDVDQWRFRMIECRGHEWASGISTGEKVDDPIDIRGITDIAQSHIEIDKVIHPVHFQGKDRAVRQVVDEGIDFAQVNRIGKKLSHGILFTVKVKIGLYT
jgi:hypothetical protein